MNINENIEIRENGRTFNGCTNNITYMSAGNYSRLPKLVPNESSVIVL